MDYRRELNRHLDSYEEGANVLDLERARVILSNWIERIKHPGARPHMKTTEELFQGKGGRA